MESLGLARNVYTLDPLPLLAHEDPSTPRSSISLSLWKEQEECLQWLDGMEPSSVVCVNFGSITVMTNEQPTEFAWGLANSGWLFLWITRCDLVKGDTDVLPPEFLAATADRGLMAIRCPQQEVLNHLAVAAFLTYGSWNSMLVPCAAACPSSAVSSSPTSRPTAATAYQWNEWGVGMEIDTNVRRDAVASLVTELMEGEHGKEMRRRALKWRDKAIEVAKPGGTSRWNLTT